MAAPTTHHQPLTHRGLLAELDRFRTTLVDQAARRCADAGWTTIALYGAGRHTRRYLRQPWRWRGVRVAAVLDDHPPAASIDGIPVFRPADMPAGIEAVVISSDGHEPQLYKRALDALEGRAPILRIYGDPPPLAEPDPSNAVDRLRAAGIAEADAAWIADNRTERHDAAFDSLPMQRTELHLRRYHLAARFAPGSRVIDAASGTGYGTEILARAGATDAIGIDIDPNATNYAKRYHAHNRAEFITCDVTSIPLDDRSADLVTSFETIEHLNEPASLVAEFARLLTTGGTLVLSTPNDLGTTDHHELSLTQADLDGLLQADFEITHRLGQIPGNDPIDGDLPPGIFPQTAFDLRPDTLIVIATRR